jgi:ATP-dependent DNA ligase
MAHEIALLDCWFYRIEMILDVKFLKINKYRIHTSKTGKRLRQNRNAATTPGRPAATLAP